MFQFTKKEQNGQEYFYFTEIKIDARGPALPIPRQAGR